MSQYDGAFDAQQSSAQDSPTIGRQQHHTLNNPQVLSESAFRIPRRAAPSPLQTSTIATQSPDEGTLSKSSTKSPVDSNYSPRTRCPPHDLEEARSPVERLDDLLASEKTFYNPSHSPDLTQNDQKSPRVNNPSDVGFRSVSDPLLHSRPVAASSPTARSPMAATSASAQRIDMVRGPPRTSSIDSAISTISNSTHSHKASLDMGTSSPDIANLIQAAGSSEAVIQYLLKEKQSSAAQNAQLWRLVDKQRAMILGLNKDLERALKDKERYRKKLKESLAQLPASASNSNHTPASDGGSETSSEVKRDILKPANVEALVSAGLRDPDSSRNDIPPSPIDVSLAPYPITPPPAHSPHMLTPVQTSLPNMVEAEHKMPSPSQHAFQQYDADAQITGFEAGQQSRKTNETERGIPYDVSLPPSRSLPVDPPRKPAVNDEPSISKSPQEQQMRSPQAQFRKAPPAPLNLGKPVAPSNHLHTAENIDDDSESDYDDILEVDEVPAVTERGRRKTREDDERMREAAALQEAERRSLSKKQSVKSLKSPNFVREMTLPTSPRQAVQILPPGAEDRQLPGTEGAAGSLAGMLSASQPQTNRDILAPPPMSPGLPSSPRPFDRGVSSPYARSNTDGSSNPSSMTSPPLSPRGMAAFAGGMPLSPRAPRQPIPLPPNTPMSISSPGLPKAQAQSLQLVSPKPLEITKKSSSPVVETKEFDVSEHSSMIVLEGIYRGFITEEYPDLLLPPNALPSIDIRVASSRLKPSRASLISPNKLDEDPVFTLAIFSRSDKRELWRVEKDSLSLAHLDQQLKQSSYFIARTPERSLFSGHAPAKVDARRVALDVYFEEILNNQMDNAMALELCRYLSTNTMEPNAEELPASGESSNDSPIRLGPGGRPLKNGYLTKRGKNFGGWKARFFVLDGPVLKYYESPGGPHLGAIKLQKAQIGKQQQQHQENQSPARNDSDDPENQYRHAFLILEPKRKDSNSLVRHVLCAENDLERDQWVEALLQYVNYRDSEDEDAPAIRPRHHRKESSGSGSGHTPSQVNGVRTKKKGQVSGRNQSALDSDDGLKGISYDATVPGETPVGARSKPRNNTDSPSPPTQGHEKDPLLQLHIPHSTSSKSISAPKNVQVIQDAAQWGNKPMASQYNQYNLAPAPEDKIKQKKRSFFGFGSKPRASLDSHDHSNDSTTNLTQMSYEQHGPIRPAFGAPLSEAVRYCHPADVQVELPAVIYRCVEYLDAKNAAGEEGIFRLSGSNVVIKQLRERFNVEGDVNLISDETYYDIHAVASLLKLYLRELPTTILTRELHLEFLAVTELHDVRDKISALNGLVRRLPHVNATLLRYLSSFLINIVNHSDTNKMTVRNVGIVFSPTLNIPAPVFALFLQQYDGIFDEEPDALDTPVEVHVTAPPLTPEDIRSPRRQKFQDLPTPSYDQQSFPNQGLSFPQPKHYQPPGSQRAAYDTGFTPMQPTYEHGNGSLGAYPTMAGPEYGARGPTLAGPSYDQFGGSGNANMSKARKRESAMFGMSMGGAPKKVSGGRMKENSQMVEDESFFD